MASLEILYTTRENSFLGQRAKRADRTPIFTTFSNVSSGSWDSDSFFVQIIVMITFFDQKKNEFHGNLSYS